MINLIFIELMKIFSKRKICYSCPNCANDIESNISNCDYCYVKLDWK